MSRRAWNRVVDAITGRGSKVWEKLTDPTVKRGGTQWPKTPAELEKQGIRFDYDGTVEENGEVYIKYQVQPNAGKIPSSWREWRDKNGGTHAVIGPVKIKKGATKDEVNQSLKSLEDKL